MTIYTENEARLIGTLLTRALSDLVSRDPNRVSPLERRKLEIFIEKLDTYSLAGSVSIDLKKAD